MTFSTAVPLKHDLDPQFHFRKLDITGINNQSILKVNVPQMAQEEICLFHSDFSSGDNYLDALHRKISVSLLERKPMPVVRFADGEYAFYGNTLDCNGLYQQAESRAHIKKALPVHAKALKALSQTGILAPLIHPGNTVSQEAGLVGFLKKFRKKPSASTFMQFLRQCNITLTSENYIPFYIVYACLTSKQFADLLNNKKLCLISSEANLETCAKWFARHQSQPKLSFSAIPDSFVATRWNEMRDGILSRIQPDTDICLVGAGIGALLVCVDLAQHFSIPVIDAGHVINMMNDRVDKSNGPRLYTVWD